MVRLRSVLAEAYRAFGRHRIGQSAAALAYYGVLTIAPLLTVFIAVAGKVVGQAAVTEFIVEWLSRTIGEEAAVTLASAASNYLFRSSGNTAVLVVSALLTVFGAIGVFVQVTRTLRQIWEQPSESGVRDTVVLHLLALAVLGVLTVGLVVAIAVLTMLASLVGSAGSSLLPLVISALATTALFTVAYRRLSGARPPLRHALWGAVPGGVGYALGSIALGFYIERSFIVSAYGSAGSLLAVLIWLYYSAMIFLAGAELARAVGVVEEAASRA